MTNEQIDQLEMLVAVETVLNDHAALWSVIPKITETRVGLSQSVQDIKATARKQESARVAVGEDLEAVKKELAQKMDELDDLLEAYADDTDNVELRQQADNSMSDYYRLSHEEFEIKVKNVIALLEPMAADIADYGLTADMLEDAKTLFDDFEDLRGKPRTYKISSKVATSNLAEQLKKALAQANRLDKLIKRFRRSQPDFFKAYTAARKL